MHKGTSHGRGITHLGVDDDPELKNIERRICLGMEDFVPAMKSKLIINIDPDKLPLTKVEDILKDPKVPNVYHIQAAVLSYFPNEIKSMVILLCSACNASYEPGAASFCSLCPGSDTQSKPHFATASFSCVKIIGIVIYKFASRTLLNCSCL
eukprot:m.54071 g.54071  ORF g.54071 m.54071 type:complete len:152 (+) comp34311_c0_seq1:838-1293(+)